MMKHPVLFVLASVAVLLPSSGEETKEILWINHTPGADARWNDAANWEGGAVPDREGAAVHIKTRPEEPLFVKVSKPVTVGRLTFDGDAGLEGGVYRDGEDAVFRFMNKGEPAVLRHARTRKETWTIPVEFERDLVVEAPEWHRIHFEKTATFTPLCSDGTATLTLDYRNPTYEWGIFPELSNGEFNSIAGFVADSLDGAPLRIVKKGAGMAGLLCTDNDYSGGTEVREGAMMAINVENLDSPFYNLGRGPVVVRDGARLGLFSSKPGIWGDGEGHRVAFYGKSTLTVTDCYGLIWKEVGANDRKFQLGGLDFPEGGEWTARMSRGCKLRVPGEASIGSNLVVRVDRADREFDATVPELELAGPVKGGNYGLAKEGSGFLRLSAAVEITGPIEIREGVLEIAPGANVASKRLHAVSKDGGPAGRLRITAPDALAPDTVIEVDASAVLELAFEGDLRNARKTGPGKVEGPGRLP